MSVQPAYVDIELPETGQTVEICIGFSWGGDATKEIAHADSYAFKDAVLSVIKTSLDADRLLVSEMADESHPLNGNYRYRGGRSSEKVQAVLDAAVRAVTQKVGLTRPCSAVLVER